MLLDEIVISVKSGSGGRGCEGYLTRPDRKMLPNGGDGGSGGDVIVRADNQTGSLTQLKSKRVFEAQKGTLGKGSNKYGQNGQHLILKVPCGTTVYDHAGDLLLRDLVHHGEEVIAVKGGRGGYGNHAGRPATLGEEGKLAELLLSLVIISDVFLIGLPGSGKTTLLKHLTGAHVEPQNYPFATRHPCLGTYEKGARRFRICELPSLYAHSSEGRGLGNKFLKHLKRARLIFLVIDPLNPFAENLKEGYDTLIREIKLFNPDFLKIPRVVLINKIDLKEAEKLASSKRLKFPDPVFQISALEGKGISGLISTAAKILKEKK